MHPDPLARPRDRELLTAFLQRFRLSTAQPPLDVLRAVAAAFTQLPYENLTKIIKEDQERAAVRARRLPAEVLADHVRGGAGGTCFALTATLLHLVRSLGWEAEPLLADRRYGENTHCALRVWIDGRPHLLDPGYLILNPLPLDICTETRIVTDFNELVLTPSADGRRLDLATLGQGQRKHRLTFKTSCADAGEFLHAWDASFDWDMMRYPVLTRVSGGRQLYLQGGRFQARDHASVRREEVPQPQLAQRIAERFGIAPEIVARALEILHRKGEPYG
ncbi:MAG: arylamine N-acetyltransferase [Pirellulaceae bacterium]|nr:arylamine N-acetyltransferase [Pirellulaceae bacterium]